MTRFLTCGLLLAGAMVITGCGSSRYVYRNAAGGTIALRGDRDSAMDDARGKMKSHCRGPYTITEEGEVVVGEETHGGSETGYTRRGTVAERSGSRTEQVSEWRVTYVCGYQQAAPAPAPGWQGGPPPGAAPAPGYGQPPPPGY